MVLTKSSVCANMALALAKVKRLLAAILASRIIRGTNFMLAEMEVNTEDNGVKADVITKRDILGIKPQKDIVQQILDLYRAKTNSLIPGVIQVGSQRTIIEPFEAQPKDRRMWARYVLLPEVLKALPHAADEFPEFSTSEKKHYDKVMGLIYAHSAAVWMVGLGQPVAYKQTFRRPLCRHIFMVKPNTMYLFIYTLTPKAAEGETAPTIVAAWRADNWSIEDQDVSVGTIRTRGRCPVVANEARIVTLTIANIDVPAAHKNPHLNKPPYFLSKFPLKVLAFSTRMMYNETKSFRLSKIAVLSRPNISKY